MRTVLCVSENPSTLISVYSLIHKRGYRCITAAGIKEAENNLALNHVDVVIVDQGRDIEGRRLSAHFKKIRGVKILLLAKEDEFGGHSAGPDIVVRKPFDAERLMESVVRLMEGH